jgi:hypothetical protein
MAHRHGSGMRGKVEVLQSSGVRLRLLERTSSGQCGFIVYKDHMIREVNNVGTVVLDMFVALFHKRLTEWTD